MKDRDKPWPGKNRPRSLISEIKEKKTKISCSQEARNVAKKTKKKGG